MTLVAYTKIPSTANSDQLWVRVENAFSDIANRKYFDEIKSRQNQESIKESLCALLVLSELLGRAGIKRSELIFNRSTNGKPCLVNSEIEFSLSHSNGYAAAAICDSSRVGIDIEATEISEEKAKKLAKRFFSEGENKEFETTSESFLKIWTKKEAYAKMHGISLSNLIIAEKKSPLEIRNNAFFEVFSIDGCPMTVCLETPCDISNLGEITI